MTKENEFQL